MYNSTSLRFAANVIQLLVIHNDSIRDYHCVAANVPDPVENEVDEGGVGREYNNLLSTLQAMNIMASEE